MRQYRRRKKLPQQPGPSSGLTFLSKWASSSLKGLDTLSWRYLLAIFPSLFCVGFLPFFPGTWGSIATVAGCYALYPFMTISAFIWVIIATFIMGTASVILVLSFQTKPDDDPQFIVIDEAVGQMIAILPLFYEPTWWVLSFVTFRFFDIKKPLLVSWPQMHLHGAPVSTAFGIMLDDVLAGIYAGGVSFCIFATVDFLRHMVT